jgi:glycerol uptake facilitator-like aquaporin
MVWAESAVSGTSCNPARTFGPVPVPGVCDGSWIHWVGPLLGTFLAMLVCSRLARRIEAARICHFQTAYDRLARRAV